MQPERFLRYREKISYIVDSLKNFPIIPQNDLEKKGIYYSIQTSIESTIDLIAMAVKDLGIQVKDDSKNIDIIIHQLNKPKKLAIDLKKANGLRNILVHRYNGIEDSLILDSLNEIKTLIFTWVELIEGILNDTSDNE